eukprot:6193539-Pleurochrysis_carterae.AAC.1
MRELQRKRRPVALAHCAEAPSTYYFYCDHTPLRMLAGHADGACVRHRQLCAHDRHRAVRWRATNRAAAAAASCRPRRKRFQS